MNDLKQKIITVMAIVLEVDASGIPENATPGMMERWDSLRHISLILALEEEFGVRFSDAELIELISLDSIVDTISEKLKGQP